MTTGLGLGPRSPVGNAVGSVVGTAEDQMRGANGGKCRFERRVGVRFLNVDEEPGPKSPGFLHENSKILGCAVL
jgi:hypothetical protein